MHIITANSAADAWVKTTKHLLAQGQKVGNIVELLDLALKINLDDENKDEQFERDFDEKFRKVFGNDRIDYASSVTFVEPLKDGLTNRLQYRFINNHWHESYWGRMVAYRGEVNQIENAIKILSKHQNIKRCEVIVYDPVKDMRNMYKQPCLLSLDFKPRGGKLYTSAFFRSQRVSKSGYADYSALINLCLWLSKETKLKPHMLNVYVCSSHLSNDNKEKDKSLGLLSLLKLS